MLGWGIVLILVRSLLASLRGLAGGLLTTLPLVIAFLLFQRQFISGATAGAVKQ